ncbi:MAG TPA: hypothetical protein VGG06_25575 [Thermoanaerobaculia bacterium]|jgi:hypothetical protein
MEPLFTFLFKYRPVVFEDGRFAFETAWPSLVVLGSLAVAALSAAAYLRQRGRLGRRVVLLVALRTLAVALVAFALLRPVVRISAAVPGENFLAVLLDDSRSMRLADDGERSRGERALADFTGDSQLLRRLQERFTPRYYRFAGAARRMEPAAPLAFDGRASDLGAALERVRQDLAGVPLAGAVLVSDGADNSGAELTEPLLRLKASGVPVYAVGVGDERFEPDLELARVDAPDRVLAGSAFAVDVTVRQQGYEGRTVTLTAQRDGAIVATQDVAFAAGPATMARVHLEADAEGAHRYRFSIAPGEGERIPENNAREALVTVEDRREKVLYVEGEPRWDVKFIRQALAGDDNVHVVVLQRSAENKLLRLGVEDPLELVAGFPETREELFAYRGLILGSVEADFFTAHQLEIVEEFVSQRGGGVLFLGGRRSFAAGGYAGTPIAAVLPVVLGERTAEDVVEVRVQPTLEGQAHAALRLASSPEESQARWETLPPLTTRHPLERLKPGASLLLAGTPAAGTSAAGGELVVLASQRYGRGRAAALTVQDSWLWQMHAEVPLEDQTHERFWRQTLRWLVSAVPRQVTLETSAGLVAPGEPVTLRADVRDAGYLGLNGARVTATVTDPLGGERTLPLEWTVENDGEYRASFVPEHLGPYEVRLSAEHAGETVGADNARLEAVDLPTESFGAEMNAPLLRRIAEETGGRFYRAGDVGGLAEDVRYTESGKTVVETAELWDMPIVLLLLLGALGGEWLLRRRWGLA